MGERVVIRDEPPLASEAPPQPLNYGHRDRAGDLWRRIFAYLKATGDAFQELLRIIIPILGGWRQIVFAFGLALVLLGLGLCIDRIGGPGPFWMFIGGLMIGLTVRPGILKND